MVCHLPAQVSDFAACGLRNLFYLCSFAAGHAAMYRSYSERLVFLSYRYIIMKLEGRLCIHNRI